MILDLFLAQFVIITTPAYTYTRWMIEQAEPYMPLGKLEKFEVDR